VEQTKMSTREEGSLRGFWGTVIAIAAVSQGIGLAALNLSPVLIDALRQGRGFSAAGAGTVQTVELLVTAFATYPLTPLTTRTSARKLGLTGAVIAGLCHVLSSVTHPPSLLLLVRSVAGIGAAMCVCAGNAVLAAQREPDRVYAVSYAASSAAFAGLFPLMVYVSTLTNGWGVYAAEGVWVLVLIPLVVMLPTASSRQSDLHEAPALSRLSPRMLLAALPIFVFTVFSIGLYSFAGIVAEAARVTPDLFAYTLSFSTALAVLASWGASVVGTRYGRLRPLIVSLATTTVASIFFFSAKGPVTFAASIVVVQSVFCFALPFMFGFCSALDGTGRLATAASSAMLIGSAVAPAIIGWLIDDAGFSFLIVALLVGYAFAGLTMYLSTTLLAEEGKQI
jgi:predicted MFS family arabinose efflux permease